MLWISVVEWKGPSCVDTESRDPQSELEDPEKEMDDELSVRALGDMVSKPGVSVQGGKAPAEGIFAVVLSSKNVYGSPWCEGKFCP